MKNPLKKTSIGDDIIIYYKNWKGEESYRNVSVLGFYWGHSPYHEGDQMFMKAWDHDKDQERNFAVKDIAEILAVEPEKEEKPMELPEQEKTLSSMKETAIYAKLNKLDDFFVIQVEGATPAPEIIINPKANIADKINYYMKAYNEDLTLKNNPKIRITAFYFASRSAMKDMWGKGL